MTETVRTGMYYALSKHSSEFDFHTIQELLERNRKSLTYKPKNKKPVKK